MKKLCFFLFFLGSILNSFGQGDAIGAFNRYVIHNWAGQYVRIGTYKVKGSPFLLGESFPGKIRLIGSNVSQPAKVLYNLYEQKAGPGTDDQILVTDKLVEEFTIELPEKFGGVPLTFKHCGMYSMPKLKCYFNVLAEGPSVSFLKVYRIRVIADPSNMMDKDLKVFEQYYEYFLINKKATGEVEQVKLKKRDFENELSSLEGAPAIFKSNQFEYATEEDFVKLVKALNNAAK
jgi:hypothetical protein